VTDSTVLQGGKRARLVDSAKALVHEQGVHATTLAEIADRAEVPLGNVYYYFKTKDELLAAVVDEHVREVDALLAGLGTRKTPRARLKALIRTWAEAAPIVARSGCPIGSLSSDLAKCAGDAPRSGASLFDVILTWIEAQFRDLGRRDARDLALMLFAGIQGACVLSNSFHDPKIMTREVRQLERWLDSLPEHGSTATRP
jgi:AcrR family transcriptional regulator